MEDALVDVVGHLLTERMVDGEVHIAGFVKTGKRGGELPGGSSGSVKVLGQSLGHQLRCPDGRGLGFPDELE